MFLICRSQTMADSRNVALICSKSLPYSFSRRMEHCLQHYNTADLCFGQRKWNQFLTQFQLQYSRIPPKVRLILCFSFVSFLAAVCHITLLFSPDLLDSWMWEHCFCLSLPRQHDGTPQHVHTFVLVLDWPSCELHYIPLTPLWLHSVMFCHVCEEAGRTTQETLLQWGWGWFCDASSRVCHQITKEESHSRVNANKLISIIYFIS